MRRLLLALVLLPGLALAQDPIQLGLGGPAGPVRYATQEVTSARFLGEDVEGPTFSPGDRLELITEKDGWVRVKKGEMYGWVPKGALSETQPEPEPDATTDPE